MFDDSRPSIVRISNIEQVNELRAYLGRPHRLRPLAVATPQWGCDEPAASAERLVGRGFDVAIVEPGSARERLNERMPRELEIRRGGLRLFSSAGGLGRPSSSLATVTLTPPDPASLRGCWIRTLPRSWRRSLRAEQFSLGQSPQAAWILPRRNRRPQRMKHRHPGPRCPRLLLFRLRAPSRPSASRPARSLLLRTRLRSMRLRHISWTKNAKTQWLW